MADDSITFKATRFVFAGHETKPTERVSLREERLYATVASVDKGVENVTLTIEKEHIVKVICNLDAEAVMMILVQSECAENMQKLLHMEESIPPNERWIIMETEALDDAVKSKLKEYFTTYDETTREEVDRIAQLKMKREPVKRSKSSKSSKAPSSKKSNNEQKSDETKIISYPNSGSGGVTITVADFKCLAADEFLNDVIIEFYLQYIGIELLTPEQVARTHIFNTFFYEALSGKLTRTPSSRGLSLAHKRHERVEKWTKNVNLFEKDFVIVPINQSIHWFLVIICFPGLIDSGVNQGKRKSKTPTKQTTKDKTASSDEEFDHNTGDIVKRPCILIFDSLSSCERNKVICYLREYLKCEYQAKVKSGKDTQFDSTTMPEQYVKVPHQDNTSDCGLFMLHYIEQFFKDPIENFEVPIKSLKNWFDPNTAKNKRGDIVQIIKDIMVRTNNTMSVEDLPNI